MGGNGSKVKRLATTLLGTNNNNDGEDDDDDGAANNERRKKRYMEAFWTQHSPLVFSRRGSMYIDEDGDVAHEFYVEVPSTDSQHKAVLKRITANLKPQGTVAHEFPRINANLPVIISEG